MPISILGNIETIGFINTNAAGEVGLVIDLIRLNTPNINPIIAPASGPSKMAPIITGICIIVAPNGGIGIIPKGVAPKIIEIADSIPMLVICLTLNITGFETFLSTNIILPPLLFLKDISRKILIRLNVRFQL
jgi:hypothetical protein